VKFPGITAEILPMLNSREFPPWFNIFTDCVAPTCVTGRVFLLGILFYSWQYSKYSRYSTHIDDMVKPDILHSLVFVTATVTSCIFCPTVLFISSLT